MTPIIPCPNCHSRDSIRITKKPVRQGEQTFTCFCENCGFSGQAVLCARGENSDRAAMLALSSYNTSATRATDMKRGLV
ncbi:hypothetical protein ACKUB1_09735 [Methanospirillum stamsii]|uniref:Uncharacterized protein n=1 Tax=Methanospirillum stamsii TaxID=1277351 RepID=A0A2V2N693_9EURY|nr:hypothetical protein [Methanospirillum stamsii]PWR75349.1 hypothetical protein DLD82_04230 [Methanospirillum stamsii]